MLIWPKIHFVCILCAQHVQRRVHTSRKTCARQILVLCILHKNIVFLQKLKNAGFSHRSALSAPRKRKTGISSPHNLVLCFFQIQHLAQILCGRCVAFFDLVAVHIQRRGNLAVSQPLADSRYACAALDQYGRRGMPQLVQGNLWQIIARTEALKPSGDGLRVDRFAIVLDEDIWFVATFGSESDFRSCGASISMPP